MPFRFALVSTTGDNLGSLNTAIRIWSVGDTVPAAGGAGYRVLAVTLIETVAAYSDSLSGVLEVEPLS